MPPRFDILIPDVNGILRGLSAPLEDAARLLTAGTSWSSSLFSSRFDGAVVEECGYGLRVGDPDFLLRAAPDTDAPVPWRTGGDGRQAMFQMHRPDEAGGAGFELDPQTALASIVGKLQKDGINSVLACELEFYLMRETNSDGGAEGGAAAAPDGEAGFCDLYSLDEIERQGDFFAAVQRYARAQNIGAGNIVSEYGAGQWEVNLRHTDAMRAAREGILLRRLVQAAARERGRRATFMAKPLAGSGGSGLHLHISLWKDCKNLFADETVLQSAVAGALAVCGEGMAFFAPFENSYRRFLPGSYAPCHAFWGQENRAAAVRVPMAEDDGARRLEFRLCGADANPILAAAALLAGAHYGLQKRLAPPPPRQRDDAAEADGDALLPQTLRAALDAFAGAAILPQYFGEAFMKNYLQIKENEWRHHRAYISDYDLKYLGRVV